jgi:hypothetical protein
MTAEACSILVVTLAMLDTRGVLHVVIRTSQAGPTLASSPNGKLQARLDKGAVQRGGR